MLRSLLFLLSVVMYFAGSLQAGQNDEEGVRQVIDRFVTAWNNHDPKKMAAEWNENGDLIDPWGKWSVGRASVDRFFVVDQKGDLGKTTMKQTVETIRFINPETAVVDTSAVITGLHDQDGRAAAPFDHHVLFIITKQNGKWVIFSARPYALQGPLTKQP